MDNQELLHHIERLIGAAEKSMNSPSEARAAQAQICEFLRMVAGPKSSFLESAENAHRIGSYDTHIKNLTSILRAFRDYIQAGLLAQISPTRQAQLDVVSDFLDQANSLLNSKGSHPAAPIVLTGATLEEFLRTWVESAGLSLGQRKPSIDSYAQVLLAESLITKQDIKDITSWAGLRNHAAHGEWEEVSDKQRAALMLEGVNLFMRKYGA